jgi:hypothetical protein
MLLAYGVVALLIKMLMSGAKPVALVCLNYQVNTGQHQV